MSKKIKTLKKNYRLPHDLVMWMEKYAKNNNITATKLVIDCLVEFRERTRL